MIATAEPVVILTRDELDALIRDAARAATLEILKAAAPAQDELWNAAQIAAYLGVSEYTARVEYPKRRGYPRAIRLGSAVNAPNRWYRKEIEEWTRSNQT